MSIGWGGGGGGGGGGGSTGATPGGVATALRLVYPFDGGEGGGK